MADARPDAAAKHARIKQLYMEVVDLPSRDAQLAALQAQGASSDEQLAVLRLLGSTGATTHFKAPVARASALWLGQELPMGSLLGAWRLLRPLGTGGMGRVYLAERADGAYEQQAALKLVRLASSTEAAERFTRERQILARLDHPNIARLLDGGQTADGWPFLVMEYVDGERIDTWCAQQHLGLAERIALLQALCDALAYAHRQLVIHCDLKPANVLVDRSGRLRLLDFGIAHIEGDDEQGPAGLTPGYASPEQMAGQAPTLASDLYSLGRLMAELCLPVAGRRQAELQALIAKATHVNPSERYADAAALRAELRRLLNHRPLEALGRAPLYALRKGLRRRWPWALAGSLALVAAGGFTWRLALERDRARNAELLAQEEARAAREVTDFLVNMFSDADTYARARASELRALTLLERGHERLRRDLADRPKQRAPLLQQLGRVLENVGQTARAAELLGEAIEAYLELGDKAPLPELYNAYASTLNRLGRYADAWRAVEAWQQHAAPHGPQVAHIDNAMGLVLTNLGELNRARQHLQRALASEGQDAARPDEQRLTDRARVYFANLSLVELTAGRAAEADRLVRYALDPAHPSAFRRHGILGMALWAQGQRDAALVQMRLGDAAAVRHFGEITGNRHRALRDYGWVLLQAGQAAEAVRQLRLALQCAEESGEAGHPLAAQTQLRLAQALVATGDRAGARTAFDTALRWAEAHEAGGDAPGLQRIRAEREAFLRGG